LAIQIIFVPGAKSHTGKNVFVEFSDGINLQSQIEAVGLNASSPFVYSINGRIAPLSALLHDNDVIKVIPIMGGG